MGKSKYYGVGVFLGIFSLTLIISLLFNIRIATAFKRSIVIGALLAGIVWMLIYTFKDTNNN